VLKVKGILVNTLKGVRNKTYKSWCDFWTRGNKVVYAINFAAANDEIWLLYDYNFPLVLRRLGDGYLILGEAMIWETDKYATSGRHWKHSSILYGSMMNPIKLGGQEILIL